jgi:hypothetical protein
MTPTISLGHISKGFKSIYKRDTCMPMLTAALFTMAKLSKQLKCPTTNEWVKKIWGVFMWVITQL